MVFDIADHQRQVHLDFHTSPYIPDVGTEFDADVFARTFKQAHVNSVTIFAKCHHGMTYYPTRVGTQHPALASRDLLGEQLEALHRHNIRCPIYTTVAWEEDVAQRFPQWRQVRQDGTFAALSNSADGKTRQPGRWRFNNFLHPDYQAYIEAHVRELFDRYGDAIDGLFFDILFFDSQACWSDASVEFREARGLLGNDPETQDRFQTAGQVAFMERFTRLISGLNPRASIFYNAPNLLSLDRTEGMGARTAHQTHWELESLPSGFWGYHHFPKLARAVQCFDKPWVGQTGRFQKMWGDFGGIKPQAALEYECFRSQAMGGANGIGDQLPPRGRLDVSAYELIGAVYKQCAAAEPFYRASKPVPQIGIIAPGRPGHHTTETDLSLEGAVQMCDDTHYDSVVLDDRGNADGLRLLILPDEVLITDRLQIMLRRHCQAGGHLLLSDRSGLDGDLRWAVAELDLQVLGREENFPTYWRVREETDAMLSRSDRVFYSQGSRVVPGAGVKVFVDRVPSYFKRTDLKFCSHFQTPPAQATSECPAVVGTDREVYFADPIFREYRRSGNLLPRDVWKRVVKRLIGPPEFGEGLSTTILLVPRRKADDLLLTFLHYIPTRKALEVDIIEEPMSFAGQTLSMRAGLRASVWDTGEVLKETEPGRYLLPPVAGRLLLIVPEYFAEPRKEA